MTDREIEAVAEALGSYGMIDTYWHCLPEFERGRYRNRARAAIAALDAIRAQDGWRTMDDAPRDQRILVLSPGGVPYAAHWARHPTTGHETWIVSQCGDDQHCVNAVRWRPIPAAPKGGE